MHHYFIIYKPYKVLSQFTQEDGKKCLKDIFKVPSTVYPVGRLDFDSEGLLLLTDDKKLNHLLLNPAAKHEREYWVQVEGIITPEAIRTLQNGVHINLKGKSYFTQKCKASLFKVPPKVPPRDPPIRFRKSVPDSWLRISLTEGKNRQVRKMSAGVGYPTLRLIRYRIEELTLDKMLPGDIRQTTKQELFNLLHIK